MNHKENVKNGKSPKFDVQYMQYYQNRGSFLSAEKPCHVFLLNTQDECNAFLDIASIMGLREIQILPLQLTSRIYNSQTATLLVNFRFLIYFESNSAPVCKRRVHNCVQSIDQRSLISVYFM
jgi:hypothetical protein